MMSQHIFSRVGHLLGRFLLAPHYVSAAGADSVYTIGQWNAVDGTHTNLFHWTGSTWYIDAYIPESYGVFFENLDLNCPPVVLSPTNMWFWNGFDVVHWNGVAFDARYNLWTSSSTSIGGGLIGRSPTDLLLYVKDPTVLGAEYFSMYEYTSSGGVWSGPTRRTFSSLLGGFNVLHFPIRAVAPPSGHTYVLSRSFADVGFITVQHGVILDVTTLEEVYVTSDYGSLTDLWALDATHVYAVGSSHSPLLEEIIIVGSGTSWSEMTGPVPPTGGKLGFSAIGGTATNDLWVCGSVYYSGPNTYEMYFAHWDGSLWTHYVTPSPNNTGADGLNRYPSGVHAVSAADVWFTGITGRDGYPAAMMLHWDGTRLKDVSPRGSEILLP